MIIEYEILNGRQVLDMTVSNITQQATDGFAVTYYNFKDFQQGAEYQPYWDMCIKCINDKDLLMNIIFCNDVFAIPPIKTFLVVYRDDFVRITNDERARLDTFVKRGIGAFWGMVFKFVLGYREQKSVSVSMDGYFFIRSASIYGGKPDDLIIE